MIRIPGWVCKDCGADMAADGRHEKFHQQCWSCYGAENNGSVDVGLESAFMHYHAAWRWSVNHVDDDTAAAAMTHAWCSIARSMLDMRGQLERIADGLENLA